MNWNIKPNNNLNIRTAGGETLLAEAADDGCYISTILPNGIRSSAKLSKEQVTELKFWLAMNVGI